MIACDEIVEERKTVPTNFNEENAVCKTKNILHFTQVFINYHSIIDSC